MSEGIFHSALKWEHMFDCYPQCRAGGDSRWCKWAFKDAPAPRISALIYLVGFVVYFERQNLEIPEKSFRRTGTMTQMKLRVERLELSEPDAGFRSCRLIAI